LEIKAGWDNYKQGVLQLSQENVAERKNAYKVLTLLGWIPLTLDYSNYLLSKMKKIYEHYVHMNTAQMFYLYLIFYLYKSQNLCFDNYIPLFIMQT